MKKILSLFLLLSLLLTTACSSSPYFDFVGEDLSAYYELSLDEITGGTYEITTSDEVTMADVEKELRRLRLYHATYGPNDIDTYAMIPEYGDDVRIFYEIKLTEDGECLLSNLYAKEPQSVIIGQWEFPEAIEKTYSPVLDNPAVSESLLSAMPAERIFTGTVAEGDVVYVNYKRYATAAPSKILSSQTAARIDSGVPADTYADTYGAEFARAVVGKTVGDTYRFTAMETVDGTLQEVTYVCKVSYIAKETYRTVTVAVPADAYDEEYSEVMQSLNGKTVLVRYVIHRYVDYATPELDVNFFTEKLGFETEETDPARVKEEVCAKLLEQMEQTRLIEEIYPQVWAHIFDKLFARKDRLKKLPEATVELEYDLLMLEGRLAYESAQKKATENGTAFSYANIDAFAPEYFGYDAARYSTMKAFCEAEAEYQVTVKVMTFAIAQAADILLTPEEYDKLIEEYLAYLIEYYKSSYQTDQITPAMIYQNYGAGTREDFEAFVLYRDTEGQILEYLYKNNTWKPKAS